MNMSLSKFQEIVKDSDAWHAAVHGVTKSQIWLSSRTTTLLLLLYSLSLSFIYKMQITMPNSVCWGFPGSSEVKNPSAKQEMWFWSLGREDPLEKENCNPLQYSCLENPMDRAAWWATVHGSQRVRHDWSNLASTQEIFWRIQIFFLLCIIFSFSLSKVRLNVAVCSPLRRATFEAPSSWLK